MGIPHGARTVSNILLLIPKVDPGRPTPQKGAHNTHIQIFRRLPHGARTAPDAPPIASITHPYRCIPSASKIKCLPCDTNHSHNHQDCTVAHPFSDPQELFRVATVSDVPDHRQEQNDYSSLWYFWQSLHVGSRYPIDPTAFFILATTYVMDGRRLVTRPTIAVCRVHTGHSKTVKKTIRSPQSHKTGQHGSMALSRHLPASHGQVVACLKYLKLDYNPSGHTGSLLKCRQNANNNSPCPPKHLFMHFAF